MYVTNEASVDLLFLCFDLMVLYVVKSMMLVIGCKSVTCVLGIYAIFVTIIEEYFR